VFHVEHAKCFVMRIKDYFLTQEEFALKETEIKGVLETTPKPIFSEISRYYNSDKYLSHKSNNSVFSKIYSFVRKINLQSKTKLITKYLGVQNNILDYGSGGGHFLSALEKKGYNAFGFEPLFHTPTKNVFNNTESLKGVGENFFSVITMWHSLEHVKSYNKTLALLQKLLKPGGVLIIACPNHLSYDSLHYGRYWAGYDVPRHLWHFSKKGLITVLGIANFSLIKTKPVFFDAYYVSMLSEKYKKSKLWFFKGFFFGLLSNAYSLVSKNPSSNVFIFKNKK